MSSTKGPNVKRKKSVGNVGTAINPLPDNGSLASERMKHKLPLKEGASKGNQKEYKDVPKGPPPPSPSPRPQWVLEPNYDFVNPPHYVQDDGKQTWEHMIDIWGKEATALWCEMTAFKYKERMGKKPNEDTKREMDKIMWYENKSRELRKDKN